MEFIKSQPLVVPCALSFLGLLLDLIGTAIVGNGGVFWYYFVFYLVTNSLILFVSMYPAFAKDLQLLQLVCLAISLAIIPSDISLAISTSEIASSVPTPVFGSFGRIESVSNSNNKISSGASTKAAGLIITVLMMFVQLVILSVPHKLLCLEKSAPAEPAKAAPVEEKEQTIVTVA